MFKKSSNKHLQRGQGMTEYIIIVGVIAVAAIGAFGFFGDTVENQIAGMAQELSGQDATAEIGAAQTAADASTAAASNHNDLSNYDQNSSGGT